MEHGADYAADGVDTEVTVEYVTVTIKDEEPGVTVSHRLDAAADSGYLMALMIDSLTVAVRIDIAAVPADVDGDGSNEGRPR